MVKRQKKVASKGKAEARVKLMAIDCVVKEMVAADWAAAPMATGRLVLIAAKLLEVDKH